MADETSAEMRLWALEVVVVNLMVLSLVQSGHPQEFLAKMREGMIDGARQMTFPGFADAAQSDHASGELEGAIIRLMDMASEQLRLMSGMSSKPRTGS